MSRKVADHFLLWVKHRLPVWFFKGPIRFGAVAWLCMRKLCFLRSFYPRFRRRQLEKPLQFQFALDISWTSRLASFAWSPHPFPTYHQLYLINLLLFLRLLLLGRSGGRRRRRWRLRGLRLFFRTLDFLGLGVLLLLLFFFLLLGFWRLARLRFFGWWGLGRHGSFIIIYKLKPT